ncbi:hypothetical protein [Pelagibacterium luteolum]|uniref:Uncharacterized protein n=1 Tax=Pelagibacterium luteolum TaxID=440168 RepID=A0A1G8AM23_9HYPH|nr:hypothetical protein [Pelagibacterium luteolum]SDH22082.1 hypothetical protein SAMN04487974_1342 [Pelagibacterium luteolum]
MHLERLYKKLVDHDYPKEGMDWLRRRRSFVISVLAILAWGVVLGLGWLIWAGAT